MEKRAQIEALITDHIKKYRLPALVVGILQRDRLAFSHAYGYADVETDRAVGWDTLFRLGSISKTFTAVGIMQLWEQSRLELDAPVNDYLKTYRISYPRRHALPVTVRQLLTHTAGVGPITSVTEFLDVFRHVTGWRIFRDEDKMRTLHRYYHGWLKTEAPPGSRWCYANSDFTTLGQIIEDISGQPFADYMRVHVFHPLGLFHTDFCLRQDLREALATGYRSKRNELQPVRFTEILQLGAGSAYSTPADIARYAQALVNGGANEHGRVLQPTTLEMMFKPAFQLDPSLHGMGLGFFINEFGTTFTVGHSGGVMGFSCSLHLLPQENLTVLLFTNTFNLENLYRLNKEILHTLTGDKYRLPAMISLPAQMREKAKQWKAFCGHYVPKRGFWTNIFTLSEYGFGLRVRYKEKTSHLGCPSRPPTQRNPPHSFCQIALCLSCNA